MSDCGSRFPFTRRFTLARAGIAELILEVLDLSCKGNNLGVSRADLAPAAIGHSVAIKDTQIWDNDVLVGLFSQNPCSFCKTHIDGKKLVGCDLCSAKKTQ